MPSPTKSLSSAGPPVVRAPHVPLTSYYSTAEERRGFLGSIFDRTAGDYDQVERLMALGSGSWYRRQALRRAGLERGMKAVDVGVGTGLVARQAALLVGDPSLVTGVDPSPGMLENARVPEGVQLLEGRAESIPLPDQSVEFLSMGYALRHIDDLQDAFREFRRVLAPGGKLCVLEITLPSGTLGRRLLELHLGTVAPLVARVFGRHRDTPLLWRYYWDTIEACAPPERVLATLESVGFKDVRRFVSLGVFSEFQATA